MGEEEAAHFGYPKGQDNGRRLHWNGGEDGIALVLSKTWL